MYIKVSSSSLRRKWKQNQLIAAGWQLNWMNSVGFDCANKIFLDSEW